MDTDRMTDIQPELPTGKRRHRPGPVTVRLADLDLFRQLLLDHDITKAELAEAVGCSDVYLRDIGRGAVRRVSKRLATKLENALGAPGRLFVPIVDTDHRTETRPNRAKAAS
jgi:DNA-binding Xre family transcriptional regulator